MKALFFLLVIFAGVWLWHHRQTPNATRDQSTPTPAPEALDMVPCTLCSVHIPGAEAVKGTKGSYCSQDHLHQAEP